MIIPLPISLSLHLFVFLIRPPNYCISDVPHLVRFNYLHRLFPRLFFVRRCRRLIDKKFLKKGHPNLYQKTL